MKGRCRTYEMERDAEKKMMEAMTPEAREKYIAEQNERLKDLNEKVRELRKIWKNRKQ